MGKIPMGANGQPEPKAVLLFMSIISLIVGFFITGLTSQITLKYVNRFINQMNRLAAGEGVLLIAFLHEYKMAKYIFVLFLIKETYMGVMGLKTISLTRKNEGAMWYGKVSTAFFYVTMILLFLVPQIPNYFAEGMICICGLLMLMALILYNKYYRKLQSDIDVKKNKTDNFIRFV